jgi:hypothetical protein
MLRALAKRLRGWSDRSTKPAARPGPARRFRRPRLERLEDRTLLAVNWANLVQAMDSNLQVLGDPTFGIGGVDLVNRLPVFGATPGALLAQSGIDNPVVDLKAALDNALGNPTEDQNAMAGQLVMALGGASFLDGSGTSVKVSIPGDNSATITLHVNRDVSHGPVFHTSFGLALPAVPLQVDGNVVTGKMGLEDGNIRFGVDSQGKAFFDANTGDFHLVLDASLPGVSTTGRVGFLPVTVQDQGTHFRFDFGGGVSNPFPTLFGFSTTLNTPLDASGRPVADVHLQLATGARLPGFPDVETAFNMTWTFSNADPKTLDPTRFGNPPQVSFDNAQVTADSALRGMLSGFLNQIGADVIPDPVKKIVRVLDANVPVLSDLNRLAHVINDGAPIKLIDLIEASAGASGTGVQALNSLIRLVDTFDALEQDVQALTAPVQFDPFDLAGANGGDLRGSSTVVLSNSPQSDFDSGVGRQLHQDLGGIVSQDFTIDLPLLENPSQGLFSLLIGQDTDLFRLHAQVDAPFHFGASFPLFGILSVGFDGAIDPAATLDVGLDTRGLHTGNVLDGLWVGSDTGFSMTGHLAAGPGINIVVASINVEGGVKIPDDHPVAVTATGTTDPNDPNPFVPGTTVRKLRTFTGVAPHGELDAYLTVDLKVGVTILGNFIGWEKTFDIANITLINFDSPPSKDQQPQLASLDSDGTLHLYMGPDAYKRANVADPNPNDPDGESENFTVYPGVVREDGNHQGVNLPGGGYDQKTPDDQFDPNTTVTVEAFGAREFFTGVKNIVADGGRGSNTVTIEPGMHAGANLYGGTFSTDSTLTYLGDNTVGDGVCLKAGTGPSNLTSYAANGETFFFGGPNLSGREVQDTFTIAGFFNVVQPDGFGRNLTVVVTPQSYGTITGVTGGVYTNGSTTVEIQGPGVPTQFTVNEGTGGNSGNTYVTVIPQGQSGSIIRLTDVDDLIVEGLSAADSITVNADHLHDSGLNRLTVSVSHLTPAQIILDELLGIPLPVNAVTVNTASGNDTVFWQDVIGQDELYGGSEGTNLGIKDLNAGDSFQVNESAGTHQVSFDDILWPTLINGGSAGTTNDVRVAAVDAPLTVDGQSSTTDLWLGEKFFDPNAFFPGVLSGINADVTVRRASLTLDDRADPNGVLASIDSAAFTRYAFVGFGLQPLPGVVHYDSTLKGLDLKLAEAGNFVGVVNTPSAPTTIEGGSGQVVVEATDAFGIGPLSILNGFFQVMLGDPTTHSMANIASDITLDNTSGGFDTLVADDSGDTNTRHVTLAPESYPYYALSGLNTRVVFDPSGSREEPVTLHLGHHVFTTVNTGSPTGLESTVAVKNTPYDSPVDFELGGHTAVTVGDDTNFLFTNTNLTVHANGPLDSLTVNDQGNQFPSTWQVTPFVVSRSFPFVDLHGNTTTITAVVNYGGFFTFTVNAGSSDNTFTVTDTSALLDTSIFTGPGNSTTTVNATTGGQLGVIGQGGHDSVTLVGQVGGDLPKKDSLQNFKQNVSVFNLGGATDLVADDSADATARTVTLTPRSITGLAPGTIFYGPGVASLTVDGGYGGNTITVLDTAAATSTTVNSGNGVDFVYVNATTGALSVNTQRSSTGPGFGGFEGVWIGLNPNGSTLDNIQGAVNVNTVGRPGIDYADMEVVDTAAKGPHTFAVTGDTITRTGSAPIHYQVTNSLDFFLSRAGGNTVNVQNIHPGLQTTFDGGWGNDAFNIGDLANTLDGVVYTLDIAIENPGSQVNLHDEGSSASFGYSVAGVTLHPAQGYNLPAFRVLRSDWDPQGHGPAIYINGPVLQSLPVPLRTLSLHAGSGNDTFTVQSLPPNNTTISFIGGSGSNTLQGPDQANTWQLTRPNAGTLNTSVQFANVQNLVGGSGNDTFAFDNGGSLAGKLDGGGGVNTLDYSAFVGDVAVVMRLALATGVSGGIADVQNVTGSQGNDLLVGDANPNVLVGGTGRNVVIGGGGSDQVTGGGGDNLLIGGTTSYDANLAALQAILMEWEDTTLSFDQRVNALRRGVTVNGQAVVLNKTTVQNDGAADTLLSGAGLNWLIADSDDTINDGNGPGPNDRLTRV